MNCVRSKIWLTIEHSGMSDAKLRALLEKIVKTAKGKSEREAYASCGDIVVVSDAEKYPYYIKK